MACSESCGREAVAAHCSCTLVSMGGVYAGVGRLWRGLRLRYKVSPIPACWAISSDDALLCGGRQGAGWLFAGYVMRLRANQDRRLFPRGQHFGWALHFALSRRALCFPLFGVSQCPADLGFLRLGRWRLTGWVVFVGTPNWVCLRFSLL